MKVINNIKLNKVIPVTVSNNWRGNSTSIETYCSNFLIDKRNGKMSLSSWYKFILLN